MDNRDNISRLCKLLDSSGTAVASKVGPASNAELLVDFLFVVRLISSASLRIITNLFLVGTPYGNPRQLQ